MTRGSLSADDHDFAAITLENVTVGVTLSSVTIVRSVFLCREAKFKGQLCLKRFVCGTVTVIELPDIFSFRRVIKED